MNDDAVIITVGKIVYDDHNGSYQQDYVQSAEGICRTIPAGKHASTPHLLKTLIFTDDEQ